jgi:aldose 1-epimerase
MASFLTPINNTSNVLDSYITQLNSNISQIFNDITPVMSTYFSKNVRQSTADGNLNSVVQIVGPEGAYRYNQIKNVPIYFENSLDSSIDIKYSATTDKKTVINMTNHSYFNLSGNPSKAATDHILYVNADNYTPVDQTYMTTGEIVPVKDTPMDFTTPKAVGQDITNFDFIQLKYGNGYDHNWVLNTNGDIKKLAAKLTSPESGISLEVYTNEPGIQVYTGNFLDGTAKGKKGIVYNQRASVCLETQHYPDSPNKPQWPSVILEPGQTYNSECIFKFSVEK